MKTKNGWGTYNSSWYIDYDKVDIKRRKFFVDIIESFDPKTVLEFGCAAGSNLRLFSSEIKLSGIDANEFALQEARKKYQNIDFYEQDITEPFDLKRKFDIVCSMGVLIHIHPEDIEQTIDNMKKHTKNYIVLIEGHSPTPIIRNAEGPKYKIIHNLYDIFPDIKIIKLPLKIQTRHLHLGIWDLAND